MFGSFLLAGFEGSTGFDRHGRWFDQVVTTGHEENALEDYRLISEVGLRAARECVRWPLVDQGGGRYDFSTVDAMASAARAHGVDVIWDLFHFGYPRGLDLMGEDFAPRFAAYCRAAACHLSRDTDGPLWFTPVNEPSYFAYAAGERALFAPHLTERAPELKVALVRAAIAGIDAIREVVPDARFLNVDPVCRVAAPPDRSDLRQQAHDFNQRDVFESWDMLCGMRRPELGGSPRHLDVVGVNYYWTNQWEIGGPASADGVVPPLDDDDRRRLPLRVILRDVFERYRTELLISETSHIGERRAPWVSDVATEVQALRAAGVPLGGVCLYPIVGMSDWHEPDRWLDMGLWDRPSPGSRAARIVNEPMLEAVRAVIRKLGFRPPGTLG